MELLPTNPDLAIFTLRLAISVIFLAHGPAKIFNPKDIAHKLNISSYSTTAIGIAETLGALSLLLGIYTRFGSILLILIMLSTIYFKTHKCESTFTGNKGWQLEFLTLAAALTVFLSGTGNIGIFN